MNTRLQVEHPVTERSRRRPGRAGCCASPATAPTGSTPDVFTRQRRPAGYAIEARVYAEDPGKDSAQLGGLVTAARFPDGTARWPTASGSTAGSRPALEVSPYYDPMLAKVIATGPSRDAALDLLREGARRHPDRRRRHQPRSAARAALDDAALRSAGPLDVDARDDDRPGPADRRAARRAR